jgi:hypothetical protein
MHDELFSTYGMPGLPLGQQQVQSCGSNAPRASSAAIFGIGHTDRNTALWLPPKGILVYAVDNTVVIDDLRTRRQRFLVLNQQHVTALASPGPSSSTLAIATE